MLRRLTRIFVHYAERYIPDPYIYALILTFVTAAAAWLWTSSDTVKIVTSWYDGIWAILAFAMQMALILSTGVALADAPPVRRLLERLASIPARQSGAVVTLFLVTIAPGEAEMKRIDPELIKRQDAAPEPEPPAKNFASVLENTPLFTL